MRKLILLIGCAALLLAGCGTAEVSLHTTLRDTGDTNQEVTVIATGGLAALLGDGVESRAQQSGWNVKVDSQGNATVLHAQKLFKQGDELMPFALGGDAASAQKLLVVTRENSFLFERYTLRVALPPDQLAEALGASGSISDGRSPGAFASALAKAVKLTWTVTMPGEIESSNADSVSRGSATWVLALDKLPSDQELYITSRSLKPGAVLILVGTVVLVALIGLMYLTLARRPHHDPRGMIRI